MGDALTGREEESKYCFFNFNFNFIYFIYLFIFLPSGGGSVPFVHPRKYAPVPHTFYQFWHHQGRSVTTVFVVHIRSAFSEFPAPASDHYGISQLAGDNTKCSQFLLAVCNNYCWHKVKSSRCRGLFLWPIWHLECSMRPLSANLFLSVSMGFVLFSWRSCTGLMSVIKIISISQDYHTNNFPWSSGQPWVEKIIVFVNLYCHF